MDTKLKPYMAYDNLAGSSEGAILVFAHNHREAKKIAWAAPSFLHEITDGEYINLRVGHQRKSEYLFKEANQEKLITNIPHIIECPTCCKGCEYWGFELNEQGYCETCAEDIE